MSQSVNHGESRRTEVDAITEESLTQGASVVAKPGEGAASGAATVADGNRITWVIAFGVLVPHFR